jgi:hypothetical protein
VTPKVAAASEELGAAGALVGLGVGVGQQVGLEVGARVEAAAAHRTLVWGLFHVQNLVHGQGPGLAEPLATLPALERLLLRVDVPATEIHRLIGTFLDFVQAQNTNSKNIFQVLSLCFDAQSSCPDSPNYDVIGTSPSPAQSVYAESGTSADRFI